MASTPTEPPALYPIRQRASGCSGNDLLGGEVRTTKPLDESLRPHQGSPVVLSLRADLDRCCSDGEREDHLERRQVRDRSPDQEQERGGEASALK